MPIAAGSQPRRATALLCVLLIDFMYSDCQCNAFGFVVRPALKPKILLYSNSIKSKSYYNRAEFVSIIPSSILTAVTAGVPKISKAEEVASAAPPQVSLSGEAKQIFNEGRAFEMQGNIPAAQRIYSKVTKVAPRFIYGWSNLGNTQVVAGALQQAEESYTKAIALCNENLKEQEESFGIRRCDDLYILLLNRGSVRLNNGMLRDALQDLEKSASLRGKPDAVVLQNRARARELNGLYVSADRDYEVAIAMTSSEVAPFWLRSALIKFEIGDTIGGFELLRRVENRFPEAPEVRAALATMLAAKGDHDGARKKFLEIPDVLRKKFASKDYLNNVVSWPPKMKESLASLIESVADVERTL